MYQNAPFPEVNSWNFSWEAQPLSIP